MADRALPKDSDFLKLARARWKLAEDAGQNQRERERDDLAFYAGEQWPNDLKLARQGQQPVNGMPAVPSRPTLVINNLREPVRQVLNEERAADIGLELVPAEDFGDLSITPDETEVKLREGLIRKIQRDSKAADARTWAYMRAVIAGVGYYQVLTRYLPGKTSDQEVYVQRIYNQASVLLDPSHKEPDGSDAKWGFIGVDMLYEEYQAEFGTVAGKENPLAALNSDTDWRTAQEEYPDWFKTDYGKEKKLKAVRVVDYWYTVYTSRELCETADGRLFWSEDVPDDYPRDEAIDRTEIDLSTIDPNTIISSRRVSEPTIKWAKIDGAQVLETTEWAGPDLPIVKVLGEELQPYDHDRRAEGMVRPARDPGMGFNYMVSKQVETVGLTPIPALTVDPVAIEGYEEWYKVSNTRALPYLPSRTYDDEGRQLKEPHRPAVDANILPVAQSIQMFRQAIDSTTAVPAAARGDIDPVTRSGKALKVLTANSKLSTSNFLDNLKRSMTYEGQIVNNLLYPIYGARVGRLVRVMLGDGTTQLMQIGEPRSAQRMQQAQGVAKLTQDAKFNTVVKVTRNFDTRREEEAAILGDIFSANPATFQWFADLWFKNQDWPGHKEMAERAKVMLPPPIQQLLAAQANGQAAPTPREMQLQAENAQLKQIAQQQAQEIQAQTGKERLKQSAETQRTQISESHEDYRASLERETKLAVAEISAQAKQALTSLQLFYEERARLGGQMHDATESEAERAHEAALAAAGAGHDADQAMQQQQHDASMAAMQSQPPTPNGSGAPPA